MSVEAMGAVLRLKFKNKSARLVLLSLADHHNRSTGRCFPSVSVIMDDAQVSRATVFRSLAWLEEKELIQRHDTYDESGRQTSSEYELLFMGGRSQIATGEGLKLRRGRVSNCDGGGSQIATGEGLNGETPNITGRNNRKIEPNPLTPSQGDDDAPSAPQMARQAGKGGGNPAYTASFEKACAAYPEFAAGITSKPMAFAEWQKQGCEPIADVVIAGIKAYAETLAKPAKGRQAPAIKNMAGWLRQRRWERPAKPEIAVQAVTTRQTRKVAQEEVSAGDRDKVGRLMKDLAKSMRANVGAANRIRVPA